MLLEVRVILVGTAVQIGIGEAHIALVATLGDTDVVLLVDTGAEHFLPRILVDDIVGTISAIEVEEFLAGIITRTEILRRTGICHLTVTVTVVTIEESVGIVVAVAQTVLGESTRTEGCLIGRHISYEVAGNAGIEVDADSAGTLTALGGNHDNAVGSFRTVEGRSGSTLKNAEVLDILGVDVGQTVALRTLAAPIVGVVGIAVVDGHTVDNDERLVGTGNGAETTHVDGDGTCSTTRSGLDAYTGCLTVEGSTEVGAGGGGEFIALDSRYGVTEFLGILLDTHGGYNDFTECVVVFFKYDIEGLSFPLHFLGHIADEGNAKSLTLLYASDGELTIVVDHGALSGSLHDDGCTGEGFACGVDYSTCSGTALLDYLNCFNRISLCVCRTCGKTHKEQHDADSLDTFNHVFEMFKVYLLLDIFRANLKVSVLCV